MLGLPNGTTGDSAMGTADGSDEKADGKAEGGPEDSVDGASRSKVLLGWWLG